MDRTRACGARNVGSIPTGGTLNKAPFSLKTRFENPFSPLSIALNLKSKTYYDKDEDDAFK